MIAYLRSTLGKQGDLILVLCVTGILMVLFMPIPSGLLDFLLISNLSLALVILLLTFYVEKPLQFSTFPSLLLIVTLFRLSLNIAATRLILSDADAGKVISTIGSHVVGGNYVIGMIVFLVLIVVQYVVVTNGAQRVAEVSARFTLDGMPGKQMSIDADLNMGLITEKQAQERRKLIEKETNFYGAMDGASKFVKGDAIAGIIIILIDIVGGLTIGIAQRGMEWGEALQTFTLLTIGDGIVTQIPALVISTGTGVIVTRAASDAFLSKEISRQITAFPKILWIVCAALTMALFIPGIPAFPVLVLLLVFGCMLFFAIKREPEDEADIEQDEVEAGSEDDIYGMLTVEALEIRVGMNLVELFNSDDSLMMDKVASFRKQYALDMGFVMPRLRAKDDKKLPPHQYEVWMYGAKVGEGELLPDRILAINPGNVTAKLDGPETRDPTFNMPAIWIVDQQRDAAVEAGYTVIQPMSVLMTHLSELVRQHSANLLTRGETEKLIDRVKQRNAGLVEELVPGVLSMGDVQKILQRLLREKVSIRNLEMILEALVDEGKQSKDAELLTEVVRQKLGASICQPLAKGKNLKVLVFDPKIEQKLSTGLRRDADRSMLAIEPGFAEQVLTRLAAQTESMMTSSLSPVLLCSPELRRHIRRITERSIPHLSVLSMSEVPPTFNVQSHGMVSL
ncbi:flagellar biosynthesis protein FlhA [Marinobacterium sp. D7]|uniref:flagellar biosynthesis protein FlhA n=1 Tax=Marinobacterium ramblicola TaxID=2849041 RepID=UPI001C2D7634|nr:flagellar biosynthesis protein FlhA [Marinobacterium ramblicola]MBV1787736.1 flagellar biosynthesis protein FlhA [Marinobacterium ramblicola]